MKRIEDGKKIITECMGVQFILMFVSGFMWGCWAFTNIIALWWGAFITTILAALATIAAVLILNKITAPIKAAQPSKSQEE